MLSGTVQIDHDTLLSSSSFNTPVAEQNTGTVNFSYLQGFNVGNKPIGRIQQPAVTASNNPFTIVEPEPDLWASRHGLRSISCRVWGFAPNTRFIRIAKNNREITDVAFRLQVITTVDQVENIYWDLVYAFEDVKVQQEAIAAAQKTLSDTRKQVQFGTLPPIQVVNAENTVATDQQALILAQTNLQLQELLMKNALTRNLWTMTALGGRRGGSAPPAMNGFPSRKRWYPLRI